MPLVSFFIIKKILARMAGDIYEYLLEDNLMTIYQGSPTVIASVVFGIEPDFNSGLHYVVV